MVNLISTIKMDETSPGTDAGKPSVDGLLEKFNKMQAYLPVLEIMINMLKNRSDKPRQAQLEKIKYVKQLIVEKKLTTVDSLRKCESLLRNYWMKFEDQLDKIPDIVFESCEAKESELHLKKDSSKSSGSAADSNQRIDQNNTQTKKEESQEKKEGSQTKKEVEVTAAPDQPRSPEIRHDSVSTHSANSESRRKNKNPVQKFNHNDKSGESSKLPTERVARPSLSPVDEKLTSKKTDGWSHTYRDSGGSKYEDDWRDVDRHKSKDSYSNNFDLHKNRQKHFNNVSGGHSSRYAESRILVSPRYVSPERKLSDFPENCRVSDMHLESSRSQLHNSRYSSNRSPVRKEVIHEREPIRNNLQRSDFDIKLDNLLNSSKKSSDNTHFQKCSPGGNSTNDRSDSALNPHVIRNICSDDSSCSSSAKFLENMSEEELKRLVTENLQNLPSLPPETKGILETIKQCSVKQVPDSAVLSSEIGTEVRSEVENVQSVSSENCQKIFQPSSRDPRRHSKDGQGDNVGRSGLIPASPVESTCQPSLQSYHSNSDNLMNTHSFIPVINQMDNYSNRQNFISHPGQIDNMTNIQPHLPIASPLEPRNSHLPHGQHMENGMGTDFILPNSPVENFVNMATHLPLPVPHFNNIGNKSSPRDPRRIQDPKLNTSDGPHQIPNMCMQSSVFQGDCRPQSAPMLNIQPLLPDPVLNRIDYCHGIQPPVPYQSDMSHPARSFSGNNVNVHMSMGNQHQVFRPPYSSLPAPRSMELSGYGRPNLHTVVPANPPVYNNRPSEPANPPVYNNRPSEPANPPVYNNRSSEPANSPVYNNRPSEPSVVPKSHQAPVSTRPMSNNQENTQNARKKVLNSWLAIDPRHSSKLPSQMAGRSKYSVNSCKFQRPLNNAIYNSQHKSGDRSFSEKKKQDEQRRRSSYDSKKSKEGEKDSSKKKNETSQSKSSSVPNSPAPNKSLFGAIIVSKDGKGKDIPQKFKIPKIKKSDNSDSAVDNDCKDTSGKSEDEVVQQMQLLFEKSLESDSVKKKLMEAIRSTLGMELKAKNGGPSKETLNSEVKDTVNVSKSENKEQCKKISKSTKSTEKRVKKYVISSSDECAIEEITVEDSGQEKTLSSGKTSNKKNESKKRPVLVSSDSSCDEKTDKSCGAKVLKPNNRKKIKIKNLKNKSDNLDIAKIEVDRAGTEKVMSQDSCLESGKANTIGNNEVDSGKLNADDKKTTKRTKSVNESSSVNKKEHDSTCEAGNGSASKKTKRLEGNLIETSKDSPLEEIILDNSSVKPQKSCKEDRLKKRVASDVHEISDSTEDLSVKKRKKSKGETQVCNKQMEVLDNLSEMVPKKLTERKKMKLMLSATESSDDQVVASEGSNDRASSRKKAKTVVASNNKNAIGKDSSGSSAEESFDSSYNSKTSKKRNVRIVRNSVESSEEELEEKPLKVKKKILVKKKSKIIMDNSSEDEMLQNKCVEKKKEGSVGSPEEQPSVKSGSKVNKLLHNREMDTEVSDEGSLGRKIKQLQTAKAKKSVSVSKNNSGTDDDTSGNEMSENNEAKCKSHPKLLKKSVLSNSDVSNLDSELDKTRSGIIKTKAKKHVIVSESDDSIDSRFSDKSKKLNASSNKNGKENSKFIESQENLLENKDPKQIRKSARRRNALEMLHDDIREMFIGNEVALAFGQRKCTLKLQSERRSEDAIEFEEKKKNGKKKHTSSRNDARKSTSIRNSSEESDSDESEKIKIWKDEKKCIKSRLPTRGKESQYKKDVCTGIKLRVLARKPQKEIYKGNEYARQNIADSFYFCKNKPGKSKIPGTKLQDVIGKLWSRVFKLGMNIQMGSDATEVADSKEKTKKPDVAVECESKSKLQEGTIICVSKTESLKVEVGIARIEKKVNISEENSANLQVEPPVSDVPNENTNLHNMIENQECSKVLPEEKKEIVGDELKYDNLVDHTNQLAEPEKLGNGVAEEETFDGNQCAVLNVVDDCDDTTSNVSMCDSDSEKGSEISLPETERLGGKKHLPKKANVGKKRKKKISNWQNGVIKKSAKNKLRFSNESASVGQDRIVSPVLVKEKLPEDNICADKLADQTYAIDGRGKYGCKYCNFFGVKIVPHYKTNHPDKEVCISRLSNVVAEKAKSEAQRDNLELNEEFDKSSVRRQKRTFVCRICHQFSEYIYDFYMHITTHTGEYDFKCDSCSYSSSNQSGVKHHILLRHNEFSRSVSLKRGPSHTAKFVYGYLCSVCNFLQLLKENVESHITLRHQKDKDAEIIRINMSIPLEEQTTNEIPCSSDTSGNAAEQRNYDEMETQSTEDAAEDSTSVDRTNEEATESESQRKRISSKNVPASMKPVVVLKGMKNLVEKGATNSGPKVAKSSTEHNAGTRNEGDLHEVENEMEEISLENSSVAEASENHIASMQKPSARKRTMDQVVPEESVPGGVELNTDSATSVNENGEVQTFSAAVVDSCTSEAAETAQQFVGEVANIQSVTRAADIPSDETENQETQCDDSHETSIPSTDAENVATDVCSAVTDGRENREVIGHGLSMDLLSSEETGDRSLDSGDTVVYKRTSLLERIEFLCSKNNASERQNDVPVTKQGKVDAGKSRKNVTEHTERSTVTTRAATIARKQISYIENVDVNRVAVENDGALIGYSSGAPIVSCPGLESTVTGERSNAMGENVEEVASDTPPDSSDSAADTATVANHDYIKIISASLGKSMVKVKPETLDPKATEADGSDVNKLELYDVTSMPDPTISSICIGPMEARRQGERILFCCRISGCDFQSPQVVKFACHYNTEHDKEWDGFCFLCGEVIDGIQPFCLEQAVEHLLSFHLTSKLKQKKRLSRSNSLKTRSPSSTTQKTNKAAGNSFTDTVSNGTTACSVAPANFVTTTVATSASSRVITNVATISEIENVGGNCTSAAETGSSIAETQSVTDLLKNAVVIKNEPCDGEPDTRIDENQELVGDPPAVCPSVNVQEERPRIRVRRISGDRLSIRTDETPEPQVYCIINPNEVPTKMERSDAEEVEQFAALDKNVTSEVSLGASSVLWPELSAAECDESVLENTAGHCSPVLWGETGGDGEDSFPSIRIESVVSLNPEANIQEDEIDVVGDAERGPLSPPATAASKRTYSRLQVDARSIALSSPPAASSILRPRPMTVEKLKIPAKRILTPARSKSVHPLPEQASVTGLPKALTRNPSRVAVIKPLSNEISHRDIVTGLIEKRSGSVLPPHKISNVPQFLKTNKTPEAYTAMLEPIKLQRLFKCMHSKCIFSTNFEDRFLAHCKAHERAAKPNSRCKHFDWNRCAYCIKACENVKELVNHVLEEHGYSLYQCAYCFFRAMSPTYVLLHQKSTHVREAVALIVDQRRRQMPRLKDFPDKRENRRIVVLPYVCAQGSCLRRFYQCDDFLQHLKKEHTQLTIYSCHLCECKSIKPEALLSHYKWHCLYQYQCMYCLHGADSAVDMKNHLCNCHSDQPNKAIIRIYQDNQRPSMRQVEDLLTIDLDEGMDYGNLFLQCPDDETEADNLDAQVTGSQSGHASPTTSESSFTLDVEDVPTLAASVTNKPGPKPKGNNFPVVIGLEGHDLFHCGNKGCIHTSATSSDLKDHLSMCDFARESSMMECVHCKKKFKTISSLVEHLLSHGAERFCCSNCGFKSTMRLVVEKHCKQVHKFPATRIDPVYSGEVNTDTMWYVIRPKDKRKVVRTPKAPEKTTYEPKDIHKLPDKDIYKESVVCSICAYSTKVRVNMVRHLEMHETEKSSAGSMVPTSCPVNPVPCLNRNEMMFDKMENLAASSQAMQAARLCVDSQPVFVQERFRYVCGVADCRYMGCDEEMLRTHICTLHMGEATYLCAHCKQQVAIGSDVAAVLEHLRMHGGKLFRCTYCAFFHYQVAQVEKHAAAKHPNQPIVPITIRRVVD